MAIETQFIAKTGMQTIDTANSNLDGTGSLSLVLTAGDLGTLLKTIIVKAQTNTTNGMVRLFVKNVSNEHVNLLMEIPVHGVTKSGRDCSFHRVIGINYALQAGDLLYASTEKAETFNIIAEGLDWKYAKILKDSTCYEAVTGAEKVSAANANLDGSGTLVQILTAGTAEDEYWGCEISSIIIKAQQSVTHGMIRLYLQDDVESPAVLFCEVIVPDHVQSATSKTFSCEVISQGSLALQPGCSVWASTENAEATGVIIEAFNWAYPL